MHALLCGVMMAVPIALTSLEQAMSHVGSVALVVVKETGPRGVRVEVVQALFNSLSTDYRDDPGGAIWIAGAPAGLGVGRALLAVTTPGPKPGDNVLAGHEETTLDQKEAVLTRYRERMGGVVLKAPEASVHVLRIDLFTEAELQASRSFTPPPRRRNVVASVLADPSAEGGLRVVAATDALRDEVRRVLRALGPDGLQLPSEYRHRGQREVKVPGAVVGPSDPRYIEAIYNQLGRRGLRIGDRVVECFVDHVSAPHARALLQ